MYVALAPGYAIRNDGKCSYIIKIDRVPDTAPLNMGVVIIPPFMGYILSHLGLEEYDDNIRSIATETGLSEKAIRHFVDQLIENTESKCINIDSNTAVIFPPNMLRKYYEPHMPIVHQTDDFKWHNQFCMQRPSAPLSVNLMVTTKCTTDCQYCYANRGLQSVLSTAELIDIVKDLKKIGVVNLSLTGGDIFALNGWQELLKEVQQLGYNPFLSTKTPLSESEIIFLKSIGCTEFQFSLDSCYPNILQELIHADSEYLSRVSYMLKACDRHGMKVLSRTVLTKLNSGLEAIKDLYNFLTKYSCVTEWSLTPAFFSEYKEENYTRLEPDNQDLESLYPFLSSEKPNLKITLNKLDDKGYQLKRCATVEDFVTKNVICLANSTVVSILANGKCSVCEMLYEHPEFILGDIRTDSMHSIWNSSKALNLYSPPQQQIDRNSPCHSCKVFEACKQSFGKRVCYMDIKKSGFNMDNPDPRCPKAPETNRIL